MFAICYRNARPSVVCLWQAELTFIPNCWYQEFEFLISTREHRDFRPISITPVLSRILERTVVKHFLYPSFHAELPTLTFADQFAFRPSGSTTAALIYILHTVSQLLSTNPYVIIIALDFSKAFDTVRHHTFLQKLAMPNIPDCVYNWMVAFFEGHTNCTKLNGLTSAFSAITASVIQGSAILSGLGFLCCQCSRPDSNQTRQSTSQVRRRHVSYCASQ